MNPLRANFAELYERHLCRHSQFGINVGHLLCVVVTYLSLYGLVYGLTASPWPLAGLAVLYLGVQVFNVPARVFLVTLLFIGLFFAACLALPQLPFWGYLLAMVVSYKIQAWSHLYWDRAFDMTKFDQKYQKGIALFILLSVYELPILLSYLFLANVPPRDAIDLPAQEATPEPQRVA